MVEVRISDNEFKIIPKKLDIKHIFAQKMYQNLKKMYVSSMYQVSLQARDGMLCFYVSSG